MRPVSEQNRRIGRTLGALACALSGAGLVLLVIDGNGVGIVLAALSVVLALIVTWFGRRQPQRSENTR